MGGFGVTPKAKKEEILLFRAIGDFDESYGCFKCFVTYFFSMIYKIISVQTGKFEMRWDGPFIIVKKLSDVNYTC